MTHAMTYQRGVALVSAIFLLVALAAMGAYMVTLSGVSLSTTDRALLGARTYFGAKAGLDWGIQQAVATSWNCDTPQTATFDLTGLGLERVYVQVECSRTTHSGTNYVYYLKATAKRGTVANPVPEGSLDYAERKLEATVSNIP